MKFSLEGLNSLVEVVTELATGLSRLSLSENFESFEVKNKTIKGGETVLLPNALTVKPSKYIITSQIGGSTVSKTSSNPWTNKEIYLKNYGTEEVTISVIFMK